ncbi:MAG: hypothetical protein K9J37_04060 [Saprospiraceae bacterium]|nr:hypothetical protein [Saprospiraceae bacterium]MCF8249060.1 hypothetical protein [Saprospiraceae bacterium]MCF8282731.1 hypothetical protein [Bacteroidales bacterium]MCF8311082.1 hypothetical protein [Saprospiraceae bacterium]MCF8440172.1 hypothetical protein [Saprospiraceae bacterium]
MPNQTNLLQHPAMLTIREGIRRDLWLKLAVGVLLLASGFALALFFYQKHSLLAVLGLGLALPGAWFLRDYLQRHKVEDDLLWQTLHRRPQQIVWVYTQEEQLMPLGLHLMDRGMLFVMLLDGSELTLALPAKKLRLASHFLHRLLPNAAFGFSEERRQQFVDNPALLVKD